MREKINVHLTADEAVAWGFADAIYLGWNLEEKEEYRATKVNIDRRHAMMEVLRKPITLKFEIS
jgi:hypothetical protein